MKRIYPFLVILVILTGCSHPNLKDPVIEDLGMVGIMGFDYVDDDQTKVTVTLPQPQQDAEKQFQIFSTNVRLPHQAIMDVSTLTEKVLTTSQLRVILFSEEYARKKGIWNIAENLYRDPHVGANVYFAVVKGTVEEMLNADYKDKPEVNIYFTELLRPRTMTSFSPFTTIRDYIYRHTDEISDPTMPYLEIAKPNSAKIAKVALFKNGKMVDTIEPEEAKLIEGMKEKKNLPDLTIKIPGEKGSPEEIVIMKFVTTSFKLTVNGNLEEPKIHVNLYIRGSIVDYEGNYQLDDNESRRKLEEKINKKLEMNVVRVLKTFQELQVDPTGFGEAFRIRNPKDWSKEKWNEAFANAEITSNVETRVISTGTIR